jgi:HEAT repeat protein
MMLTLTVEAAAAQPPSPVAPTRPAWPMPPLAPSELTPLAPLASQVLLDRTRFEFDFMRPLMTAYLPGWSEEDPQQGSLSRLRPEQRTPEDSLFRAARETLNRGEYTRAAGLFESFVQKYPRSRAAPAAYYWSAFALYRAGATRELQSALAMLKTQQDRYPEAAADPDAATLRTRLYAALAARGDAQAAAALRASTAAGQSCDREEMEVRAEALNALAQLDAPEARPTLKRVLARRDECSTTLRRRAVYILSRNGTDESVADLIEVAKNDPDPGVRSDAIMLIARSPGAATVKTLEQLFNESSDERVRQAALSALRARGGPEAKRVLRSYIEKAELSDRVRAEAILQLASAWSGGEMWVSTAQRAAAAHPSAGDEEDAAFLRGLYPKSESRTVKEAIISAVARMGGSTNEQWLLGIAKNREEEIGLRRASLSRIKTSSLSIEELGKLFDALSERELRYAVVSQLASRDDPAAVDKLIEIVRSGTDPQVRRQALAALTRKNDPRTTKLLLELIEKP